MRFLFTDRTSAQSIWDLISRIAAALVGRGDEVTFCRWDDGHRVSLPPVPSGVRAVDVPVPAKRRPWDLYRQHESFAGAFCELLRQTRPDVVHTHFCVPGVAARVLAARQGATVVSTQHELYGSMHPHYRWALRWSERRARTVVYVSHAVARSFGRDAPDLGGCDGNLPRHVVIPNGVDRERMEGYRGARRDPHRLVCPGRLVAVKGQQVLIRALPAVIREYPDIRLRLVGSGPDEGRLRRLAARLSLADRVEFTGWLPHGETLREIATAGAAVITSTGTQEGFGLVVAEAMALGTPLVVSRIAAFEEVLGADGRCGLLAETRNPQSFAAAILHVLGSPDEAGRRAAAAARRVACRFSSDRMAAQYLSLYDRLETARPARVERTR